MKIGHISDLHWLDTAGTRLTDFLNKRISGGINLLAGRARTHSKETTRCALEAIRAIGVDHLIVTGDLTNLALPAEFRAVKAELNRYFEDDRMTVVPGNHDFYTRESARNRRFEAMIYAQSPGNLDIGTGAPWPFVRIAGDVAIVGLNSARPRPWFVSGGILGRPQLAGLEIALKHPQVASRMKIVALHHHLVQVVTSPGESLRNLKERAELLETCRNAGVEMIVHGHNHDYTLCKAGGLIISEPGSVSVRTFKHDCRAGKFNIYHVENGHVAMIETYRFENGRYSLWKTWKPDELPAFPTPSPLLK